MREFFGDIQQLLFVPYAGGDYDKYVNLMIDAGFHAGYDLVGIHTFDDAAVAVENAEAVYVGGGNTFRLIDKLHSNGKQQCVQRLVNVQRCAGVSEKAVAHHEKDHPGAEKVAQRPGMPVDTLVSCIHMDHSCSDSARGMDTSPRSSPLAVTPKCRSAC